MNMKNFNEISDEFERNWGFQLVKGKTYMGTAAVAVFVTFDCDDANFTGYGDTVEDAIENLRSTIYKRLEMFCNVIQ